MRSLRWVVALSLVSMPAIADPRHLTLDDSTRIFREHGYETALTRTSVSRAEADVSGAGMVQNPLLTLGYGRTFEYDPSLCAGCSANTFIAGLSDQGTLSQVLFGKRGTRVDAAERALDATKAGANANLRAFELQVKVLYVDASVAKSMLAFATEVQASATKTLEVQRIRFPKVIDEGALARFETVKLQADQAVDIARIQADTVARRLAVVLSLEPGVEIDVDTSALDYRVPSSLAKETESSLVEMARKHRADLEAAKKGGEAAELAVVAAKRQRVPDLALSVQYSQAGTGQLAIQPPTLTFGLAAPIPLFYQQQGEVRRAESERMARNLLLKKTAVVVDADVRSAYAALQITRGIVERFQKSTLDRAKRAEEVISLQYSAGSGTLIDLLDAQRVSVATKADYLRSLGDYWTRIFQLEQAVGVDLR